MAAHRIRDLGFNLLNFFFLAILKMRVIFLWIHDFKWKIFLDFRCYKFAKVLMLLELIMGDMWRSKRMMKQLSTSFCTSC